MIGRHAHPRADAECVDEGAITHQRVDRELVERAAGKDAHVVQPRTIQHPATALRQCDQIAAVDADAEAPGESELFDDLDRVFDSTHRVVRVDEKRRAPGKVLGESPEGFGLAREGLDVRVGHGARRDQAVTARGLDVAGGRETDHRGQPGHVDTRLDALCAAKGEVLHVATAGRYHTARGFARDGRLEGHLIEEQSLDELGFGQRRRDLEDGLARQRDASLGDRPYVAGEAELAKCFEVVLGIALRLAEISNVVFLETKVGQEIETGFDPGGDEKPTHGG